MKIYAIRDTCVKAFLLPMYFQNNAAATRAIGDAVNKATEENQFYQHPEHFQLYHLGEFDEDTGQITPNVAPEFVVDCQSLVRGVP